MLWRQGFPSPKLICRFQRQTEVSHQKFQKAARPPEALKEAARLQEVSKGCKRPPEVSKEAAKPPEVSKEAARPQKFLRRLQDNQKESLVSRKTREESVHK